MIDIHSHILPGLDDGAGSLEEALAIARRAIEDGIRVMVATPHVVTGLYDNDKGTILAAVERLQRDFLAHGVQLSLLPGAEYRLEPDLHLRMDRGGLLTLNDTGRYLLVELPSGLVPGFTGQVFYELQLRGVTPVIAHPERNAGFAGEPGLLYRLVERGALVQITAGSLAGALGPAAAAAARALVKSGCAHFIASDAHAGIDRAPCMSPALKEAQRLIGRDAQDLVSGNPDRVVRGGQVRAGEIRGTRPAQGLSGLLGRLVPKRRH